MIDRYVVGGFYRVHAERGHRREPERAGLELRAAGLRAEARQLPRPGAKPGASAPNRFYMYGVIGRLAMLAASYELEATDPEAGALTT
jgi:glutamate--cysteine ligase